MKQKTINNLQTDFAPKNVIAKYQKALQKTRDRVNRSYTATLNPAAPKVFVPLAKAEIDTLRAGQVYSGIQEKFFLAVEAFVSSLQAIVNNGLKTNSDQHAINISLMAKQYEFAVQLSEYLGQPTVSKQPIPLIYFLKILREQIQFKTDENGEKVKNYPAAHNRDYVKDEKFVKLYEQLTTADDNESNLYTAFLADCETLNKATTVEKLTNDTRRVGLYG